jgi:hypothetical protein
VLLGRLASRPPRLPAASPPRVGARTTEFNHAAPEGVPVVIEAGDTRYDTTADRNGFIDARIDRAAGRPGRVSARRWKCKLLIAAIAEPR